MSVEAVAVGAAEALTAPFGIVAVAPEVAAGHRFTLQLLGGRLALVDRQDPRAALSLDFDDLDLRRHSPSLSRKQPLAKAIGGPGVVIDATAGLCRDAVLLAALGHEVVAIERSPVVAALASDALRRAAVPHPAIAARVRLLFGDARLLLAELPRPAAVYVDPMFPPKRKRSALPRKGMRMLREVVGEDRDAGELVEAAIATEARRVVVKRPTWAPPLRPGPTATFGGKLARYDLYSRPEEP